MENNILKHRMAVMDNIAKSFGYEKSEDLLEKAEDNDIEKAKHQDGDMHPNGKWVWRASANGGKGDWRVAKNSSSSTSGGSGSAGASGGSDSRVSAFMSALKVVNSKFTDENKIKVVKTDKGNWDTTYDGHRIGVIRGSFLSEKVAKEKGWLEEDDKDTKKSSNTVTHDINGTKVTVTKNSDGSYTLEANGKKVKSDDPSFFVNGTNLKPRVKAALAKEVGLETKKKGKIPDESEVKSMMQWMSKKNGSNWTVEDRDKAMEFMSRVPSKFKSSNRNIINALNATLKNLYIEHNK